MKLRPYHNPENVDESKVPDGWRFRYKNEIKVRAESYCRMWRSTCFSSFMKYAGVLPTKTYIVPVNA